MTPSSNISDGHFRSSASSLIRFGYDVAGAFERIFDGGDSLLYADESGCELVERHGGGC